MTSTVVNRSKHFIAISFFFATLANLNWKFTVLYIISTLKQLCEVIVEFRAIVDKWRKKFATQWNVTHIREKKKRKWLHRLIIISNSKQSLSGSCLVIATEFWVWFKIDYQVSLSLSRTFVTLFTMLIRRGRSLWYHLIKSGENFQTEELFDGNHTNTEVLIIIVNF